MAKSASEVAQKMVDRASVAGPDYLKGVESTTKDQSALAIAAIPLAKAGFIEAADKGRIAKGLGRSGKAGHIAGVRGKGVNRYGEGVAAGAPKYAERSAPYDAARNSAAGMPRGPKGSPQNLAKVTTVVTNLRAKKLQG